MFLIRALASSEPRDASCHLLYVLARSSLRSSLLGSKAINPIRSASIELHTFTLTGGSLFGIGTAAGDEGTFAIVGGTGRYAGLRGSYQAVQRPNGVGGDGSAEFTLNLSA